MLPDASPRAWRVGFETGAIVGACKIGWREELRTAGKALNVSVGTRTGRGFGYHRGWSEMKFQLGLLLFCAAVSSAAEVSVNTFGAKGDGTTVDTGAIQKALDEAAKSNGAVVFNPGVYLTGSLFLKSNTQLRIDEGVELRGVQDLAAYPMMPTRVAGIEMKWPAALINVYEQSNVQISGKGRGGWRRQNLVG